MGKYIDNNINNILIVSVFSNGNGGGDTHLNYLTRYWRSLGIDVNILTIEVFDKFNLFNNVKYSLTGVQAIMKLNKLNDEDILKCDVILSASPYPADLFHAIKLGKKNNNTFS